MSAVIPESFSEWRHCIEVECAIPLTSAFIAARLAALRDDNAEETVRFVRLYGAPHWRRVVSWFEEAQREAQNGRP